jgi:hypothetical protein
MGGADACILRRELVKTKNTLNCGVLILDKKLIRGKQMQDLPKQFLSAPIQK